jgi:hypothetical protein
MRGGIRDYEGVEGPEEGEDFLVLGRTQRCPGRGGFARIGAGSREFGK